MDVKDDLDKRLDLTDDQKKATRNVLRGLELMRLGAQEHLKVHTMDRERYQVEWHDGACSVTDDELHATISVIDRAVSWLKWDGIN